jgi:hypothetical protein
MNTRPILPAAFATLLALLGAPSASAVGVTLADGCGKSLAGSSTATVNVAASGDLSVTQFSAPYSVAVGQCDTLASGQKPKCTLSASHTAVELNSTVTLFAKCATPAGQPVTSYAWTTPAIGPAVPGNANTLNTFALTFPNSGAYSYSVSATNANGAGPSSPQATVLVGNSADTAAVPTCVVTFSPVSILQGETAAAKVVCQPEAATLAWDAPEASAPPAPSGGTPAGSAGTLTFSAAGAFTYKVQGKNAAGTGGPKASAMVNVKANGPSCTPGPVTYDIAMASPGVYSPELTLANGNVAAFSFSVASGLYARFEWYQHSAYNIYPLPDNSTWSISQCKGDMNATGTNCKVQMGSYADMVATTNSSPSYCVIQPNTTYYLNVRQDACVYGSGGTCGFKLYRRN